MKCRKGYKKLEPENKYNDNHLNKNKFSCWIIFVGAFVNLLVVDDEYEVEDEIKAKVKVRQALIEYTDGNDGLPMDAEY